MSENTKIEWCDGTVNWWAGCSKVSPACDKCYAERMAGRLWGTQWGAGMPRVQFAGADATLKALDRKAKRLGQPLRVFHNSLSDFFDKEVPVQWRIGALRSMLETPNLIHLVLTKRIGNAAEMLETAFRAVHAGREGWANNVPSNIWIGATIVNQEEADRDIPKLLAVPAAKRFLSMEPLLGRVDLRFPTKLWGGDRCNHCCNGDRCDDRSHFNRSHCPFCRGTGEQKFLDWVIVGGESGPGARPMHPDWARSLRDQCEAAGVPFLFKQWGEWSPGNVQVPLNTRAVRIESSGAVHPYPPAFDPISGDWCMHKVGKKAAGRMLDGRTWDDVPRSAS
ncbi:COG4422 Bacteriophage protein gp37 [Comamonadaceae bacterium]